MYHGTGRLTRRGRDPRFLKIALGSRWNSAAPPPASSKPLQSRRTNPSKITRSATSQAGVPSPAGTRPPTSGHSHCCPSARAGTTRITPTPQPRATACCRANSTRRPASSGCSRSSAGPTTCAGRTRTVSAPDSCPTRALHTGPRADDTRTTRRHGNRWSRLHAPDRPGPRRLPWSRLRPGQDSNLRQALWEFDAGAERGRAAGQYRAVGQLPLRAWGCPCSQPLMSVLDVSPAPRHA